MSGQLRSLGRNPHDTLDTLADWTAHSDAENSPRCIQDFRPGDETSLSTATAGCQDDDMRFNIGFSKLRR
ncbi:MAG: hypothetical protein ACT4QE_21675 [Anaerolineales bacterium]